MKRKPTTARSPSAHKKLNDLNEKLRRRNTVMSSLNRALTFSRDYNEAIFKTVREPLLVLNSDLQVQMANQSFYRNFKVEKRKTLGRSVYDLGNGQWDIPELRRLLEHIIPENTHFEDYRVVQEFPNIGRKAMLLNARMIDPLNSSKEMLILLAIEDVTAKEDKAERTHLQILDDLLVNIPMAGIAVSAKQGTVHVNKQLCSLFAMEPSFCEQGSLTLTDLIARLRKQVTDTEDYGMTLENVWRMTKPLLAQEVHLKDGRILLCDYSPVFHAGVHAGHLILYRDITRERRMDATKSEFMSLASHQLRTPLTSIRWTFGRLGKSMASKVNVLEGSLLEGGRIAAMNMAQTIDTMLAIAHMESKEATTTMSKIALGPFLRGMIATGREFRDKAHVVTCRCPADISVRTDPKLLKEIMVNLLHNAKKYSPDRSRISMRAKKTKEGVSINIRDSGYGIPLHQHDKIFQKFFRGENIVSRDTTGTGLGLYLVSLITTLLGGTISFVSKEGKHSGTTFTLFLPQTVRVTA